MKPELVAIVSAAVGALGALLAGIQTVRTARLRASVDVELEKIRQEAALSLASIRETGERRRKALELAMQEAEPVEEALAQAWRDIQAIKEEIAKVVAPMRYDLDLVVAGIAPAAARLVEGYARWGSSLPKDAGSAWHHAKNTAGMVELLLRNQLAAHGAGSGIEDGIAESLREARTSFTDRQIALAQAREGLRHELTKRLLEDL